MTEETKQAVTQLAQMDMRPPRGGERAQGSRSLGRRYPQPLKDTPARVQAATRPPSATR